MPSQECECSCIRVSGVSFMYTCVRSIVHIHVCQRYRSCIRVRGIVNVYVCQGYRSCIRVSGVSFMYTCVRGIVHVHVCQVYRSCTRVSGVSFMYTCVRGIHFASVSTIFLRFCNFPGSVVIACFSFYYRYKVKFKTLFY